MPQVVAGGGKEGRLGRQRRFGQVALHGELADQVDVFKAQSQRIDVDAAVQQAHEHLCRHEHQYREQLCIENFRLYREYEHGDAGKGQEGP